jgi:hypothetical protein
MEMSVPPQIISVLSLYPIRMEFSSSLMERNGGNRGSRNGIPELGPNAELGQ